MRVPRPPQKSTTFMGQFSSRGLHSESKTDFGHDDTYVGQVKGAILAVAPAATLVDLTHAVEAQDVQAGAFLLWSAVEAFAANTPPAALFLCCFAKRRRFS